MPDKPLTIATYAAGASLAAITLVYVFGPTFFIDGEAPGASSSSRKRYAVGLLNAANDCFINSALQALAGLGDLRIYLIRETHRRRLDGPEVYARIVQDPETRGTPGWKIEGLQRGIVTWGMKDILDALNERPLTKKSISPQPFIACMEQGYKTRINRQQQDVHEFLILVAERLCDEYHAGHRARKQARQQAIGVTQERVLDEILVDERLHVLSTQADGEQRVPLPTISGPDSDSDIVSKEKESESARESNTNGSSHNEEEGGFPLEGASESQIKCLTCDFTPKTTESSFNILTLSVPQVSSTSLNSCFDDFFKVEHIEGFKCEKCRLEHALSLFKRELASSTTEESKTKYQTAIEKVQHALNTDPEQELPDVELPDPSLAPRRKIGKHNRITRFPKVLAIHLSRSIFDVHSSTTKNSAKVSFEERLTLGGLLDRRVYRLSSVICHKGSHSSGHYESFRRQTVIAPFSTPNVFNPSSVYSKPSTPAPSGISTPQIRALQKDVVNGDSLTLPSTPELLSPTTASSSSVSFNGLQSIEPPSPRSTTSTTASSTSITTAKPSATSPGKDSDSSSLRSVARSARAKLAQSSGNTGTSTPTRAKNAISDIVRGKRKPNNRWWRISDSKVKECKTSDVLGMQRDVYMLFYELEPQNN